MKKKDQHGEPATKTDVEEVARMTAGEFLNVGKRIDGLEKKVDEGFKNVDTEFQNVRHEMNEGFQAVRNEMDEGFQAVRKEMNEGFRAVLAAIETVEYRELRTRIAAVEREVQALKKRS